MFESCSTVAEVKEKYRTLCFQYHPDVSGFDSTEKMQDINEAYFAELKRRDGEVRQWKGKEYEYRYNPGREGALIETLARIIKAQLPANVTVEIVGIYIWIGGTDKRDMETRQKLLDANFIWHGKRKRWFWKPPDYRSRYNSKATYTDLKYQFGFKTIRPEADEKLLTA